MLFLSFSKPLWQLVLCLIQSTSFFSFPDSRLLIKFNLLPSGYYHGYNLLRAFQEPGPMLFKLHVLFHLILKKISIKAQPSEPVEKEKRDQEYSRFLVNTQSYWTEKRVRAKQRNGKVAIRKEGGSQTGQGHGSNENFM